MTYGRPTRRILLGTLCLAPWASLGACRKEEPPDRCRDLTGLSEADQVARALQQYTDHALSPEQQCDRCDFWEAARTAVECGTCRVLRGPIRPTGSCTAFARKR